MRIFVSGGSGVLGRALIPLLSDAGHQVFAPARSALDLYDPAAVTGALRGIEAVYHLATRIPPPHDRDRPGAWAENDRLRAEATRVLVDAAITEGATVFVLPSVTFVYPAIGPADEETPVAAPANLTSMIAAEAECHRFTRQGGRGVILRLGLLWGPGTGSEAPENRYGASLHTQDAGRALALALTAPAGIYNAVSDSQRISNQKLKATTGWQPSY